MKNIAVLLAIFVSGAAGLNTAWSAEPAKPNRSRAVSEREPKLSAGQMLEAERQLAARGFQPGDVDGVIDEQAEQALGEFQKRNNLPVTKKLDRQTSERLGVAEKHQ
ncbi:MAG TPA: peptidoglycan-binding domain-containing protein [Candidatus Acidoferrales bacterium]|nr:peptidoglycan-binding domain-containing protein [Candidatus Acidoferrales bacterium]